ncbi:MAG: cupredoxin domain-containing protein [Nitrososphaeraceae archaeon]
MTFYKHNSLNPFISLLSLLWLIVFVSSSSWLTTPVIGIEEATTPNNTDTELLQQASLELAVSSSSVNNSSNVYTNIPNAESIYNSESLALPTSVGSFIILIANEAHESWQDERHKLITDKNSYYIPKNLRIPQGTTITFLNADAPWDTPHPQTVEITEADGGEVVYSTGTLEYTNSSEPRLLPVGNYTIVNTEYEATEGTISVDDHKSNGNLVVGGFYTPTALVENNKDNDGGVHPGSLDYYRTEFPNNGFRILSEYNFTFSTCDYCPGEYWPDNKTGNHTLIVFATEQPLADALVSLKKLVKDNVYV